jgi:RHS repeat-associated protein
VKNNSTNALIKQYTYGYDTASNRTSETVATATTTSTPNNVNEITSQSGGTNRTLTYDLNGSITSDGGTRTLEWDGANRLVAINYTGFTTRSEFTYDGLSRVAKIVEKTGSTINSTRKFVWEGQEKLEFRDATDAVTQRNFAQGQYVGTTAYFYTRDHLGSIREMFSGGGTVVARYDYDPYGRSTTVLGTTPTDFNFTGLYRHSKSNLDLATYRAYDSDLGRWLSRDPIAEMGGLNLYAYVGNSSSGGVDPFGLRTLVIINGRTSGNPFGHTAIALQGRGVYSFGNDTPLGSSTTEYLAREAARRDSSVFLLDTTPAQEEAIASYLQQFHDPNGVEKYPDNCVNRTATPLELAGLKLTDPSKVGLPMQPTVDRFPASLAGAMSVLEGQGKASRIDISKGDEIPGVLRLFNPR